jgi:hypothetical protein
MPFGRRYHAGNSLLAPRRNPTASKHRRSNFVTGYRQPGRARFVAWPVAGILRLQHHLDKVRNEYRRGPEKQGTWRSSFLRAHYYFILVRFFGDVPLTLKPG